MTYRNLFIYIGGLITIGLGLAVVFSPDQRLLALAFLAFMMIGWYDVFQKQNAILRDYPIIGHMRYILRGISPELQQYFVETNTGGEPFNKNTIRLINKRSNNKDGFHPFGTEQNFYKEGLQWVAHSLFPAEELETPPRVQVGSKHCKHPYSASLLNISAMSFGSLSENAIKALNEGAALGGFYHNTGEGSLTPYHQMGGDIVMQIGTGNFGFRDDQGKFHDEYFKEKAHLDAVKMIEIKLSQGAKPGHGGVLPAAKNTPEIAKIRKVKPGTDVFSPPVNPEIKSLEDIGVFIERIRKLSDYKPVGFKMCVGSAKETEALIDNLIETDRLPDFITVDASEGGTGAAPIEYSNHIGMRGEDALRFMNDLLQRKGVRDQIKIIYSGKVCTAFTMLKALCHGADICNSARGFMFSLGCIQSLRCNTDTCPTGIATQNKHLQEGLVPEHKRERVKNYHNNTVKSFLEMMATIGVSRIEDLSPQHIHTSGKEVFGI